MFLKENIFPNATLDELKSSKVGTYFVFMEIMWDTFLTTMQKYYAAVEKWR